MKFIYYSIFLLFISSVAIGQEINIDEALVNVKREVEKENYDKVKVWFDKEGGGKDFEDVYCYWFNQKTHLIDYLAYTNGGPRFRRVKNRKTVGGIVFQDYEQNLHLFFLCFEISIYFRLSIF